MAMMHHLVRHRTRAAFLGLALLLAALPAFAAENDLRSTVREALLSDPRTAQLTAEQFDALVELLSSGAIEEGVTSHDILWQPTTFDTAPAAGTDASSCIYPRFMCSLSTALGLDGSAPLVPIALGALSAILLVIIGYMIEHHRRHKIADSLYR